MDYNDFLSYHIDLSPLGLEPIKEEFRYFCTPENAFVFAKTGVDGIHFCTAPKFGETIFAVSPMNQPGNYVHPIAESFADFLRLLLACGNADALEQCCDWDRAQFDLFLRDNPASPAQRAVLAQLRAETGLKPINDPFGYIKNIQKHFDYAAIPFEKDYEEWVPTPPIKPQWNVYFHGGFWQHYGKDRPGTEIPISASFDWAGRHWLIPAVYACGQGLVIDFCMQVSPTELERFLSKWKLDDGDFHFTHEEEQLILRESPLHFAFTPYVAVNKRQLDTAGGQSICYSPSDQAMGFDQTESAWLTEQYRLAPDCAWTFFRWKFRWNRRTQLSSLRLRLQADPVAVPGAHFRVEKNGDSVNFINPITDEPHTLTVISVEQQTFDARPLRLQNMEMPKHYTLLTYTVTPPLPPQTMSIFDCADSDQPRTAAEEPFAPNSHADSSVCVIGGADGPTAILFGGTAQREHLHTACSSLHFTPQPQVEWRMTFYEKPCDDLEVALL